jgi:iron complex transport system substrate-binding protein
VVTRGQTLTYSREAVVAANPDCILVVTMGLVGQDEARGWLRYEGLAAAASNRIHLVDSERVCSPTPRSFVEALEWLVGVLHPARDRHGAFPEGAR